MARGNHLYNLSPVIVGTGALMEADPGKHCSCPAHTLQPAAPSLQGDVCLFPAIFGGVITSLAVWHSLLHCCLSAAGYRAALSGTWDLDNCKPTGFATVCQQHRQQGSCVLYWERYKQQKRSHLQTLSTHGARCTCGTMYLLLKSHTDVI